MINSKVIARKYEHIKAKVIMSDGGNDLFEIRAGLSQGDMLVSYCCVIATEFDIGGTEEELIFKIYRRRSSHIGPVVVTVFDFVDDIAFLSEKHVKELVKRVATSVGKDKLDAGETKYMAFHLKQAINIKNRGGLEFNEVSDFISSVEGLQQTYKDAEVNSP